MKYFILFILISILLSCNNHSKKNFVIEGNIMGFTKGIILLNKKQDTTFVSVDSFSVKDDGNFLLTDEIDSPEIYYIKIKEIPNDSILIFAEKSTLRLNSKLGKLSYSSKVSGSENHDILTTFKKMIGQFNDSRLEIFKANLEAEQKKDSVALDSIDNVYKNHIRRRYLYSTNFAVNHANKEVAPYIALTELYNANINLLDTVNNSLSEKVKNSKYGRQLDQFITIIKKNEMSNE